MEVVRDAFTISGSGTIYTVPGDRWAEVYPQAISSSGTAKIGEALFSNGSYKAVDMPDLTTEGMGRDPIILYPGQTVVSDGSFTGVVREYKLP